MNHPFVKALTEPYHCIKCKRNYLSHTKAATCEACGKVCECDLFGKLDDARTMLLCPSCTQKEIDTVDTIMHKSSILRDMSVSIDTSIRYNGDFFNAKVVALADLKKAIMADESLGTEQERAFAFQNEIAKRHEHLKTVIFELDNKKHEAVAEQNALRESLRTYGAQVREEIRERIKASDANYTPHQVIKPPKISSPAKLSPMDKLVQMYATTHGVTKEQAREAIEKGRKTPVAETVPTNDN